MQYRNDGPAWRRSDGTTVPPGGVFDATDRERARFLRRRQQQFVCLVPAPTPEPIDARWGMRMAPERYLQLYPTGPQADLARSILASRTLDEGLSREPE